jgi:hypothetical protein
MIPREAQDALRQFFPPSTPWESIELTQESLRGMAVAGIPLSVAPRPIMAMTLANALARALQTVGMTIGKHIFLDPNHGDLETAAGLALLGHEVVHVNQGLADPRFEDKYAVELRHTNPNRPWENKYELPAYTKECEVYWAKIAEGWPPGNWKPMGVQLELCAGG